ncbi:hypothetical protein ABTL61_19620, partial [Acinetobacter baumannii]
QEIWNERSQVNTWCQQQMMQTVDDKNVAIKEYQKAIDMMRKIEEIRLTLEANNEALERQINQLKNELKHARGKAKRLADKSKNVV